MLKQHANVIPSGLPTLLEGFSRAALKKRPSNLGSFAWYYFTELIKYKTDNESFDLKKLVREFHKHMADRISGDGFEEELKKEGYKVTSNVNQDYNELCITGEVDLISWDQQCDDTNNMHGEKLVREFHKHMADRISGDGFEEELKKEGYKVTSNVNQDYNELCITGEVDLISWDQQCDDTNNMHGEKTNVQANSYPLDKSQTPGGAAEDTNYKVHPEGNQKPRAERHTCPSEPFKRTKGPDASVQSKMQNDVSIKKPSQCAQVKIQMEPVPSRPKRSQSVTDLRTRRTDTSKQAQGPGTEGTTTTACVHTLNDTPRNQINATNVNKELKPSACTVTTAAQKNNPAAATREAVTEQHSFQLRESSLGPSNSTTDDRNRWALHVNRDGNNCPPPPFSAQSQPQHQHQPQTGQSGIPWGQQPGALYHHPHPYPPYGPPSEPYGWYPPGHTWFSPPQSLPPYPLWPPPGPCPYPWGHPCPCFMWPYMGWGEPAMPRSCHASPGFPPRACSPNQVPPAPRQNAPIKSDSTIAPDPIQLPVDEQSTTRFPWSLYPPAFGSSSFYPGPMAQRGGEMPSSNDPNRSSPYNPNSHILTQV